MYRALLEIVLYGNTEINVNDLKEVYKRLTEMDSKTEKCQMELEFDVSIKKVIEVISQNYYFLNIENIKNGNGNEISIYRFR